MLAPEEIPTARPSRDGDVEGGGKSIFVGNLDDFVEQREVAILRHETGADALDLMRRAGCTGWPAAWSG